MLCKLGNMSEFCRSSLNELRDRYFGTKMHRFYFAVRVIFVCPFFDVGVHLCCEIQKIMKTLTADVF